MAPRERERVVDRGVCVNRSERLFAAIEVYAGGIFVLLTCASRTEVGFVRGRVASFIAPERCRSDRARRLEVDPRPDPHPALRATFSRREKGRTFRAVDVSCHSTCIARAGRAPSLRTGDDGRTSASCCRRVGARGRSNGSPRAAAHGCGRRLPNPQ